MRYGIISDLHSNIEATSKVLEKIDQLSIDKLICLGDLVGYYFNPNEIVELMIKRDVKCIMGNHDVVACGNVDPIYFNPSATAAILWTRDQLTEKKIEFIKNLPDFDEIDDAFRIVHGSVADRDEYLLFRQEIEKSFEIMENEEDKPRIAFFGHTHRRIYYEYKNSDLFQGREMELKLEKDTFYLINPGSVGQPRDSDPRASFCVFDTDESMVEFYRVEYDIDGTAGKVRDLPFGESLAKRLYRGA